MEHIEEAGIHSGDSACSLPAYSLPAAILKEIETQTVALARALKVVGLMNVQFAVKDSTVYILEVNPRASRTVPFVAKATGVPVAKIASRLMAGEKLKNIPHAPRATKHVAVKESVFPFARFPGVDIILGPEMKSTGEAMGIDSDFPRAFAKAHLAAGSILPASGRVFISVKDSDKKLIEGSVALLLSMGFEVVATHGTAQYMQEKGHVVTVVNKVREGRPHIVDMMKDGHIQLVINTTEGVKSIADSFSIRRTALLGKIPYSTTLAGSRALVLAIAAIRERGGLHVRSLQDYFAAN
jgi:carbamoyl-phosphate synthase large subunit